MFCVTFKSAVSRSCPYRATSPNSPAQNLRAMLVVKLSRFLDSPSHHSTSAGGLSSMVMLRAAILSSAQRQMEASPGFAGQTWGVIAKTRLGRGLAEIWQVSRIRLSCPEGGSGKAYHNEDKAMPSHKDCHGAAGLSREPDSVNETAESV